MGDSIDGPTQHQVGPASDVLSTSADGQRPLSPATSCGQASAERASVPDPQVSTGCGQAASSCTCGAGAQYLDEEEMDAWRAFLTASTTVTVRLNHELEAGAGISMHEYEILVRLSEAPRRTLRMSSLAQDVSHSRSRLTRTVSRLEQAGYVARTVCSMDKRGVNCMLTAAGESFLRTAAPIHLDGVRRHVIDRLERPRLAELTALLRALTGPETSDETGTCGA